MEMKKALEKFAFAPMVLAILGAMTIWWSVTRPNSQRMEEHVITHWLPRENTDARWGSAQVLESLVHKKELRYELNGDDNDQYMLSLIRHSTQTMNRTRDTTTYLCVSLSDSVSYGAVASLINIMQADHHRRYMLLNNDFYIIPPTPADFNEQAVVVSHREKF